MLDQTHFKFSYFTPIHPYLHGFQVVVCFWLRTKTAIKLKEYLKLNKSSNFRVMCHTIFKSEDTRLQIWTILQTFVLSVKALKFAICNLASKYGIALKFG